MDSTTGVSGCRVALEATRWREWSWWHRSAVPEASTPPAASKKPLHCAQVTCVETKVCGSALWGSASWLWLSGGFVQRHRPCLRLPGASASLGHVPGLVSTWRGHRVHLGAGRLVACTIVSHYTQARGGRGTGWALKVRCCCCREVSRSQRSAEQVDGPPPGRLAYLSDI